METKVVEQINETKSWLYEKMNKVEKTFSWIN
jgi:hypothetical protein